jgi:hypothetical protein
MGSSVANGHQDASHGNVLDLVEIVSNRGGALLAELLIVDPFVLRIRGVSRDLNLSVLQIPRQRKRRSPLQLLADLARTAKSLNGYIVKPGPIAVTSISVCRKNRDLLFLRSILVSSVILTTTTARPASFRGRESVLLCETELNP